MLKINHCNEIVICHISAVPYQNNGRTAIVLIEENGERFGTLTTNIPEVKIEDDEIIVRSWGGNEGWYKSVAEQMPEVFQPTNIMIDLGYCWAEVWKFNELKLLMLQK